MDRGLGSGPYAPSVIKSDTARGSTPARFFLIPGAESGGPLARANSCNKVATIIISPTADLSYRCVDTCNYFNGCSYDDSVRATVIAACACRDCVNLMCNK